MDHKELLEYILQNDRSSTLPTLNDLCYTIFMYARTGKNPDDGGPVDWFNDTKPKVEIFKALVRKKLED